MAPQEASERYIRSPWLWAVPAAGASCGVGTIALVYHLTSKSGHLPSGVSTPPISFLGAQEPEHSAYQLGFAVTGLLLGLSMRLWCVVVEPMLASASFPKCARFGRFGGWMACFGATGQGLVTLEPEILVKIGQRNPTISMQSIVHQLIAAFFFIGSAFHCYSVTIAVFQCSGDAELKRFVGPVGRAIKLLVCLMSLFASPLAQMLHPAAWQGSETSKHSFAIAGLAQYLAVGSYILYFGSYSIDFFFYKVTSHNPRSD
eukprot:TRINITY_DN8850_c0_g1_i2.p1 TRINITY_DN8850_c0_g1~~TRINITY_DN8850_c0_g1_i2.p1  ORF type:complete len:290 (-),score=27.45 TRINITY_DN8850_c0_g1_i2:34-810(-)